jgi:hypothetical protein
MKKISNKKFLKISLILISVFLLQLGFQNCSSYQSNNESATSQNNTSSGNNTGGSGENPSEEVDNIPIAIRMAAATQTANSNSVCTNIAPFYWEIGDKDQPLASGSTGNNSFTADTRISIASVSKWFFGAYVAEKRNGLLSDYDMKFLTMQSGYTSFKICPSSSSATIQSCSESGDNGLYTAENENKFYYGGGHFERWALENGLASMNRAQLDIEYKSVLGDIGVTFNSPQPAGGMEGSANNYSAFLRRILRKELKISNLLGYSPVCTEPSTCDLALNSPFSPESNQYSVGHWIEVDPQLGDGSFSSAGAFGFYPWIDSTKTYYGVISRSDPTGARTSVNCGRLIRRAFIEGRPY